MQPLAVPAPPSIPNPFSLTIRSRNPLPTSPQQLTLDTLLTCNLQKITSLHTLLTTSGIPQSHFLSDDWIFIFQLFCNPGCQKQLIDQINQAYDEEGPEPDTVFEKMIRKLNSKGIKIDLFEGKAKVFVKLTLTEGMKEREVLLGLGLGWKEIDDVEVKFVMKGERVTKEVEGKENVQTIKFHGVELNVKSQSSPELGQAIQTLLKFYSIVQQPLLLLSSLSSFKLNLYSTSLSRIDQLINIQWQQQLDIKQDEKKLVQNEFKFWCGYQKQFMSESTVKIDSPSVFLRQMQKNVWEKIK